MAARRLLVVQVAVDRDVLLVRDRLSVDAADFASGYIAETPAKLRRRLLRYYEALHDRADFPANICNAPWVSSVIETDGTVRPCFFQPALGNLYEAGSLAAIIYSPEAIAWRKGLDVRRDAICRKCVCTLSLRDTNDASRLRRKPTSSAAA